MVIGLLSILLAIGGTGCSSKAYFAKINDVPLTVKTLNERQKKAEKVYTEKQGTDFAANNGQNREILKKVLVESLVMFEIFKQTIQENKWDASIPEIQDRVALIKSSMGDEYSLALEASGMIEQDFINNLTFQHYVTKDITVTDEEVKEYFNAHIDEFSQKEQVQARHILVATEEEALDIIKQLKEGADFAELAQEKSLDTGSKFYGGELGIFVYEDMVPEFSKAAFALAEGAISAPVQTQFGYHIIQTEKHFAAYTPTFEEAKGDAAQSALAWAKDQKYYLEYDKAYHKAKIEYAPGYTPDEDAHNH